MRVCLQPLPLSHPRHSTLVVLESSNHKRKKDPSNKKDLGFGSGFGSNKSSSKSKNADGSIANRTGASSAEASEGNSKKQFFYADTELSANASGSSGDDPAEQPEASAESKSSSPPEPDKAEKPAEAEVPKEDPVVEPITAAAKEEEAPVGMPDYIKLEAENDPRRGKQVNVGASSVRGAAQSGGASSMNELPQPIDRAPYQPPPGQASEAAPAYQGGGGGGDAELSIDPDTAMYIEALEAKMRLLDEKMRIIAEASQAIPADLPPSQYAEPGYPSQQQRDSIPVDRSDLFSPGSRYPPKKSAQDLAVDSPSFLSGDSFITGGKPPAVQAGNRAAVRTTPATAPGTGMSNNMASIPVDREDLFLPGSPHPDRYLPGAPNFPTSNNPNMRGQQPQYAQQPFLQENLPRQQSPPPPPPPPGRVAPPPPPEKVEAAAAAAVPPPPRVETPPPPPPPPARDALLPDRSDIFLPRSRNDVYMPGSPVSASGSSPGVGTAYGDDRPAALPVDREDAFLPARPGMNYPQSPPPPPQQQRQQAGPPPEGGPPALSVDRPDAYLPVRPGANYPQPPPATMQGGPAGDLPSGISMDRSDVFLPAPTHSSSRTRASSLASDLAGKLKLDVDAPGKGFSNGDAFARGVPPRDNRVPPAGAYDSDGAPPPQSLAVDRPDVYRRAATPGAAEKPSLTSQQLAKIRALPEDTPRAFNPGPDWRK